MVGTYDKIMRWSHLLTRFVASTAMALCTASTLHLLFCPLPSQGHSVVASSRWAGEIECSVDVLPSVFLRWDSSFVLQNYSCYLTLPAPIFYDPMLDDGPHHRIAYNLPLLRQVALIQRAQNDSAERCGFCRGGRSDQNPRSALTPASNREASLEVRRCVDQRLATTDFYPFQPEVVLHNRSFNYSWQSVIAWTHENLTVLFDGSCSSRDLFFVYDIEPKWSICRPMANGASMELRHSIDSFDVTLFAQDRELSSWLPLPAEYACRDGKDYLFTVSATRQWQSQIEIALHGGPASDSCRTLCVEQECDLDYNSNSKMSYWVVDDRPLRVKYKVRSTASHCNSNAYTGFALRIIVHSPLGITLATYEQDSPFRIADADAVALSPPSPAKNVYAPTRGVAETTNTTAPTPPVTKQVNAPTSIAAEIVSTSHFLEVGVLNDAKYKEAREPSYIVTPPSSDWQPAAIASGCVVIVAAGAALSMAIVTRWRARRSRRLPAIDTMKPTSALVLREGEFSSTMSETKRYVQQCARSHTVTLPKSHDSALYYEIVHDEPLAEQLSAANGTYHFLRKSCDDCLVAVSSRVGRSLATAHVNKSKSLESKQLDGSDDGHIYSELGGHEADYMSPVPNANASIYSDLL